MDRALIRWYGLDRHNVCTEANMRTVRRGYFALISYLDHQLGELIAVLEEQGLRDKTAVLLVADHGEMLFEHGMVQKECSGHVSWCAKASTNTSTSRAKLRRCTTSAATLKSGSISPVAPNLKMWKLGSAC